MENKHVKAYRDIISQNVSEIKSTLSKQVSGYIKDFDSTSFDIFNSALPYVGEVKNKIFFTYSNHYKGNRGEYMSVGSLHHANTEPDDRGYIKGVATDLSGYVLLRKANNISSNISVLCNLYFPKFKQSTYSEIYINECRLIESNAIKEIDSFIKEQKGLMNARLKEITNLSLLFYISEL